MSVVISADATDAFSHLLMVGLASILEDANPDRVCLFRWLDDLQAFEIKTNDDLDIDQISKVVSEHAKRWSQSLPLTSQDDYTVSNESDKPSGAFHATMSPRLSNLGVPYGWEKLQRNREAAVDAMETFGDYRYFGALGQPSYWSGEQTNHSLRSDFGASRWEMVTRNKGQEFIGGRLFLWPKRLQHDPSKKFGMDCLARQLRMRLVAIKHLAVLPRAFTLHRKTDNARAWCALIGVSAFPTRVTTIGSEMSRDSSAAMFQIKGPIRFAILPLFDQYWTTAKYRSVIRSEALAQFGIQQARFRGDQVMSAASDWLEEKGVPACCLFNQFMSDNKSAPERWLEPGEIIPVKQME